MLKAPVFKDFPSPLGRLRVAGVLFLSALPVVKAASASAQQQAVWQMDHSVWTSRNLAPRGESVLAQAPDGRLWIGSDRGLFTFDGHEFTPAQSSQDPHGLLRRSVWQLLVKRNGNLWFAAHSGGLNELTADGQLKTFAHVEGEQDLTNLGSVQQDSNGTIWCVYNDKQVAYLDSSGKWQPIGMPLQGNVHTQGFMIGARDTLWLVQQNTLYLKAEHETRFRLTAVHASGPVVFRLGADDTLWIEGPDMAGEKSTHTRSLLQHVDRTGNLLGSQLLPEDVSDFLVTSDSLWLAVASDRLLKAPLNQVARADPEPHWDQFSTRDGLLSTENRSLFQDQEGNVWAGGELGLEHFAPSLLTPALRNAKSMTWSTCVDRLGGILIGGAHAPLLRVHQNQTVLVPGVDQLNSIYCQAEGTWMLDIRGIAKIDGDELTRLPLLPNHSGFWDDYIFTSVLATGPRQVLAWSTGAKNEDTLWSFDGKAWHAIADHSQLGRVISMTKDSAGHLLLGRRDGRVDILEVAEAQPEVTADTEAGAVIGFSTTSDGVVAFGPKGLALISGKQVKPLHLAHPQWSELVSGVVQSRDGDYWINGALGVFRVPHSEILAALGNRDYGMQAQLISRPEEAAPLRPTLTGGSAHSDKSGRLWFATMDGVVSIDPRGVPDRKPPLVRVFNITGDGHSMPASRQFAANTQTLRVQYSAAEFTDPLDVHYRYRLDGFDTKWQDAGSRREVAYTNLKPGTYRFSVIASIADGAWSLPVETGSFRLLPRFWQTVWFAIAATGAGAFITWYLARSRMAFARRQAELLAEQRFDERARISRELHDTLLQGVQGLLLSFNAIRQRLSMGEDVTSLFERILLTTETLAVEARERIANVRMEAETSDSLRKNLSTLCSSLRSQTQADIRFNMTGRVKELNGIASEELYFIAREALRNAIQHAHAGRIDVSLRYGRRLFELECQDDGEGFDPSSTFDGGVYQSSWGLRGMRERAELIRARLVIHTRVGAGTRVEVSIDSRVAYRS